MLPQVRTLNKIKHFRKSINLMQWYHTYLDEQVSQLLQFTPNISDDVEENYPEYLRRHLFIEAVTSAFGAGLGPSRSVSKFDA